MTTFTMPLRVMAVLAGIATLAACTGGDDATPPTTVPTSTTTPVVVSAPPDLTAEFVRAFADESIEAASVVVSGSDAARYLELRRTTARVLGLGLTAQPGIPTNRLCDADGCAVLGDLVLDADGGLVESLSVDGRPVAGRISGIGPLADADGVVARTRVAYVTNAGQLVVVVVATNSTESDVELFGFGAVYRPADGERSAEAAGSWGEAQIDAGASGTMVLVFDVDDLGGRIALFGLRADGLDVELDIAVPNA